YFRDTEADDSSVDSTKQKPKDSAVSILRPVINQNSEQQSRKSDETNFEQPAHFFLSLTKLML
ncbi:hypothetical protein, partial [Proteiniphilum sp. UBA7639]|uniref:hypothetical protein n=1 Tax=Proteiniphilum sp. UBA7639 TaxID=1947289 RepID=UPI000EEDC896